MNTFGWIGIGVLVISITGILAAAYVATHIDYANAAKAAANVAPIAAAV